MKIGFYLTLVFGVLFALANCDSTGHRQKLLLGAWKTDSTFLYYNGFIRRQYEQGEDWATHLYHQDGKVEEQKFGTSRAHQYAWDADNLIWSGSEGEQRFLVLELNAKRMVLKKIKPPLFPGENQERYEIRYFSKLSR
jgi:hypothetical protein